MNRIQILTLHSAGLVALALGSALAQAPEESEPPAVPDAPRADSAPRPRSVERFNADYTLREGEEALEVVVVKGDVVIEGTVRNDVVCILGEARLASTAAVGGDLVVIGGELAVEPGAAVGGDLVTIGGQLDVPPDFAAGGDQVSLLDFAPGGPVASVLPWFTEGLVWGRPIVPRLPWVWVAVLLAAVGYLAINLLFERPVAECVEALSEKPLTTCLVGVMALLLVGPVTGLLALSVIGLPVVPFLWLALFLVGLFGRASVFRWLGGRVMPEGSPASQLEAARSLAIGMGVICLAYMVPVLGFTVWATVGVFGMGAAATTLVASLRKEHPPAPKPPAADAGLAPNGDIEASGTAAAPPAAYPSATFLSRLGAVAVDVVLLAVTAALLDLEASATFVLFLVYHVVLWGWKATTLGGMICQTRVVLASGAPLQFSDALVRGLASIVSTAVAGLGWFWAVWDPKQQSWHDKIAGTYVLRVPPDAPLP